MEHLLELYDGLEEKDKMIIKLSRQLEFIKNFLPITLTEKSMSKSIQRNGNSLIKERRSECVLLLSYLKFNMKHMAVRTAHTDLS